MDPAAERREQADAPVAEIVEAALDDDRAIVRHGAGGRLIVQVAQQVFAPSAFEVVQAHQRRPRRRAAPSAARERVADGVAQLDRTPARSPCQNGILPGSPAPARRARESCVISSIRHVERQA
jgi:hypothetical protein